MKIVIHILVVILGFSGQLLAGLERFHCSALGEEKKSKLLANFL